MNSREILNLTDLVLSSESATEIAHNFSEAEEAYEEFVVTSLDEVQVILIVCEVLLSSVIILGNLFVLALFWQERKAHHISHKYIISMAISDLMQGLFNAPVIIYLSFGATVADDSCLYALVGGTVFAISSLTIIVATSIDRYWAICHPFSYKANSTTKIAATLIISSWLIGIISGVLVIPFQRDPPNPELPCFVYTERVNNYFSFFIFVGIILPCNVAVSFMYIRIYRVIMDVMGSSNNKSLGSKLTELRRIVMSRSLRAAVTKSPQAIEKERAREIRTTIILFLTVILYIACWIPGLIVLSYLVYDPNGLSVGAMLTAYVLTHFNSAINPFLYAFNIKGAKGSARHLLKRIFCMVKGPPPRTTSFVSHRSRTSSSKTSSTQTSTSNISV